MNVKENFIKKAKLGKKKKGEKKLSMEKCENSLG
jgi:hypothetical protein